MEIPAVERFLSEKDRCYWATPGYDPSSYKIRWVVDSGFYLASYKSTSGQTIHIVSKKNCSSSFVHHFCGLKMYSKFSEAKEEAERLNENIGK